MDGNFSITLPSRASPFQMQGVATITDLQRVWGEQLHQVSVQCLKLTGRGNELYVDDMDLEYQNESAIIKGKLLFKPKTVHLDIRQQASFLSERKLSDFIEDLSHFFKNIEKPTDDTQALPMHPPSNLTGKIHLQADSFLLDTEKGHKLDEISYKQT